jgi:hypothetical protein
MADLSTSIDARLPQQITYRKLLEFFFQIHDPSTRNRQGNDSIAPIPDIRSA